MTLDVGNTNIVMSVFEGEKSLLESRIDTNPARMSDQYIVMFDSLLRLNGVSRGDITGSVISSVVPPVTRQISLAVKRLNGIEPLIVGPGLKSGLNIKIDNPAELAADLACGAIAAKNLYKNPCIAIDLGTATKVLAIDKTGALLGGVIAPGVGVSFKSMSDTTALLPLVSVEEPGAVIGSNTIDCIRGGIIYGTACMLDGLIERFESQLGEKCSLVATGGFSEVIVPHCKHDILVNKRLVSEGMRIIYEKNR
ncbi:MAG: type III pantothenate kinase [Oscillospiraceae bacterium]|nr:type III pantothenate kinase [Oscillospiraceae bacterium]